MSLGEGRVLISVVVCSAKTREGNAAAKRVLLVVEQVPRGELVVVAYFMINAQLGLPFAVSLRNKQGACPKLNIAGRSATRASANVNVLERRLSDYILGDIK